MFLVNWMRKEDSPVANSKKNFSEDGELRLPLGRDGRVKGATPVPQREKHTQANSAWCRRGRCRKKEMVSSNFCKKRGEGGVVDVRAKAGEMGTIRGGGKKAIGMGRGKGDRFLYHGGAAPPRNT